MRLDLKGAFLKKSVVLLIAIAMVTSTVIMIQEAGLSAAQPYTGSPPGETNITVYFHNLSTPAVIGGLQKLHIADTLNDTVAAYAGKGQEVSAHQDLSVNFTLFPQLAGALSLNGTFYSWIYMTQNSTSFTSGHITLSIYLLSPSGASTLLGSGPATSTSPSYPGSLPTAILLTGPDVSTVIPRNYSLSFSILAAGSSTQLFSAYFGDVNGTYYSSRAVIPATDYLQVANIWTVNASGSSVYSLQQTVKNRNVTVFANLTDPFGAYDFHMWPVDFSIANASGAVLDRGIMSEVGSYSFANFSETYSFTFNYSTFSPGLYTVSINATDNTMHNYLNASGVTYGRNAFGRMQLYVGTPPVSVSFTVRDSTGNVLAGAPLRVYYSSSFVGSNVTNSSGIAGMLLSGGNYSVSVYWEEVPVGEFTVNVSSNISDFNLIAHVYSPTISFVSQNMQPLSDAQIYMISPAGLHLPLMSTEGTGSVALQKVPWGNYPTQVFWHGSEVFNGTVTLSSSGPLTVDVSAYTQQFIVKDASGAPVPAASVLLVNTTTGIDSSFGTTNISGDFSALIPYGYYNVAVYWRGIQVFHASSVPMRDPTLGSMQLNASIYTVTIRAVDRSGQPLSGATVSLFQSQTGTEVSSITGASGSATFLLAAGNYTVTSFYTTTYDMSTIHQTVTENISISSQSTFLLKFKEVYPPFTSTLLFVVVIVFIILAAAAVSAVLLLRRNYSHRMKNEKKDK